MAIDHKLKYYRDLKNSLDTAEEDGYKKAEQKFALIIEEERKQKEEERRQKEEERKLKQEERRQKEEAFQKILELAKLLGKMGVPVNEITDKTGLTIEQINDMIGKNQ